MHAAEAESSSGARRRGKALAALAALALLLHGGALSGLEWAWPQQAVPPLPSIAMQVRAVAGMPVALAAPEPAAAFSMPMPAVLRAEPMAPAPRPALPHRAAVARVATTTPPLSPARVASLSTAAPMTPPIPAPIPAPTAPAPPTGEETLPSYRTRLPPAATLRYEMQRGGLQGHGELLWRPGADRYELRFEGRVAGLTVLTQVSEGGFDGDGIAPLRYTDRRVRRPLAAANFQRDAGKITYSGPQTEYPLRSGAQDRLSWMVQLGAIVAAEPDLALAGAKVVMFVSGSHGDAGVWAFRCVGPEAVASRSGSIAAIRFRREPRGPYDTTVEVWLDPQRHHLPVRATLRAGPNDDGLDLRLQDIDTPP